MPRPKPPPTPSASTDIAATETPDMEGAFTLPPPAVYKKPTPPASPAQRPMTSSSPRHKRTLSGATKSKEDLSVPQYDLPPPPSRARKIIQMKPKSSNSSLSEASEPTAMPPKTTGSKRKQPSATSAAGRKIARKTAHSIIERRRRSKMNEEFGVLKDMIPACEGVEMHKLAILQAGIEYVRYLEDCIRQIKGEKETEEEQVEEEEEEEEEELPPKRSATNSTTDWRYRKPSTASSSTNPSPDILPQHRLQQPSHRPTLPSIPSFTTSPAVAPQSATPTPTLLSPAFNAIHFSPELSRTGTNSTATSILSSTSPNILPLPQSMMSLDRRASPGNMSEGGAEATATAALMMLTKDRRSTMESKRGNGMSVRDLLTS